MKIVSSLNAISRVALPSAKDLGNVDKVPGLNIIVLGLPSVDVSFNGVSLVANNKATVAMALVLDQVVLVEEPKLT